MSNFVESFIAALEWNEKRFGNNFKIWPRDMVLNISCKLNDPTVQVYTVLIESNNNLEFRETTGQVVHMKAEKMKHYIVKYNLECHAVAPPSGEAVPKPFFKGVLHVSASKLYVKMM